MNTEFSFTDDGDLHIALTAQGRQFIEVHLSLLPQWTDTELFLELIDDQLMHGWYVVPTQQVRTRSEAVLLTRQMRYDEHGGVTFVGAVYWYPQAEMEAYVSALQGKGSLLFKRGYQGDPIQLKMITG
jgi:hypothetical protein